MRWAETAHFSTARGRQALQEGEEVGGEGQQDVHEGGKEAGGGGEELQGADKVGVGGSQRLRKPDKKLDIFCVTKKNVWLKFFCD